MELDLKESCGSVIEADSLPVKSQQIFDIDHVKQHFSRYIQAIEQMVAEAEALIVDSDQANETATFLGTSAKQVLKKIEEERAQYVNEPNNYVKAVNGFVKIFTDKLKHVENLMKSKIASFRAIQEQKRREAELALQKATEELQKKLILEAKEKGIEPVTLVKPTLPKAPPVTRTETGASYGRKVWTFEVVDPNFIQKIIGDLDRYWSNGKGEKAKIREVIAQLKALSRYLVISEKEVRDAIQAGVREIPGIRIFQEERTTFRT